MQFMWQNIGISQPAFALLLSLVAIVCFRSARRLKSGRGAHFNSPFLRAFSVAVLVLAGGLFIAVAPTINTEEANAEAEAEAPAEKAVQIASRHSFFFANAGVNAATNASSQAPLVETAWLAEHLGQADVRVIDCRPQPAYNGGHIPGAVCLNPESFRGVVGGVSSMLLPAGILAEHLSLMGIRPDDLVVLAPVDAIRDATILGMGLERVDHRRYALLNGGYAKWIQEQRPLDTRIPEILPSEYPVDAAADTFTVDYKAVLSAVQQKQGVILDARPPDNFSGAKSDEVRGGHMPGAVNRAISQDVVTENEITTFKPLAELETAYAAMIPTKDTQVIVHCRTGHQASQTFFVLKHLLGYANVKWYDAGWSEWSSRPELPVEKSAP